MTTIVQKYGGSSVETIDKMKLIANRIIKRKEEGNDLVVVVSAMGKTTNNLIDMAKSITPNPCKRELDMLMSTGEQISISLLSMILKERGYDSVSLTGFQAGIKTLGSHTKNRISEINIENIRKHLDENKIVVVAGFQGINAEGDITTLGRGGSDTTAVALAAKLECPCEIYTDVEGIYAVDPRVYANAKKLDAISYEEMMEMASLGAKVMETRSIEIGQKYGIPIYVALSSDDIRGTYIKELDDKMEEKGVTGISISDDVLMVTVNNVPYTPKNISEIFGRLAGKDVNIDMISQTSPINNHVNVSFTAQKEDIYTIDEIMDTLSEKMTSIRISKVSEIAKISVIGMGMRNQSGIAAKVFKIFSDNNIEFKLVTTSEISISYTINKADKQKAVNVLAQSFNL